jgi:hypothetical protein
MSRTTGAEPSAIPATTPIPDTHEEEEEEEKSTVDQLANALLQVLSQFSGDKDEKNHTKPPPEYDGDRKKYEAFRHAAIIHAAVMKKDSTKILMVLSRLTKGPAYHWAHIWREANLAEIVSGKIKWETFLKTIDDLFRDRQIPAHAQQTLQNLRMRRDETAAAFFNAYEGKAIEANMMEGYDTWHVNQLKNTLPEELTKMLDEQRRTKIDTMLTLVGFAIEDEGPKTEKQLESEKKQMESIKKWDWTYRTLKEACIDGDLTTRPWVYKKSTVAWWGNKNKEPTKKRYYDPKVYGEPMDVDAITEVIAKMTRQELMKEGRCYKCRQKGHRFFECKNPPHPDSTSKGKATIRAVQPPKPFEQMDREELEKFARDQYEYANKIASDAKEQMKDQGF